MTSAAPAPSGTAQTSAADAETATDCPEVNATAAIDVPTFSILICGPGDEIYELEGHAALRMRTPYSDSVISWGEFSFDEPGFVYRFVSGQTDYWCGQYATGTFVNMYAGQGRWVVEHKLDLKPEQALKLQKLVNENLKPENRKYRYKYLTDNCSTRPLALVEQALGYPLQMFDDLVSPEGNTYREMMSKYHSNYPWYQLGIDIALGPGIDRPLQQRNKAFAPIYLDQLLTRAYYIEDDGSVHKLVSEDTTMYAGTDSLSVSRPTPLPLRPVFLAWCVFIIAIIITLRDIGHKHITRWFDAVLYSIFGIVGLVLFYLIFFSEHEATSPNYIIMWLNPLCLLVPITIYTRYRRLVGYYQWLNLAGIIFVIAMNTWRIRDFNAAFYPLILADIARAVTYITIFKFKKPATSPSHTTDE